MPTASLIVFSQATLAYTNLTPEGLTGVQMESLMLKHNVKIDKMKDDVGVVFYTIVKVYFGFLKAPIYISQGSGFTIPSFESYEKAEKFIKMNKEYL